MTGETKLVKGGFRATLALIISIVALILSVLAYMSIPADDEVNSKANNLQASLEKIRQESAKQIDKLRKDMAKSLKILSEAIEKGQEVTQARQGTKE